MMTAWGYAAAGFAAPALVFGLQRLEVWLERRRAAARGIKKSNARI